MNLSWNSIMRHALMPSLMVALLVVLGGCDESGSGLEMETGQAAVAVAHEHATAGETCFICDASKRTAGRLWCKEHGRYEDRCWLCHPEIEDKDRLYCKEHSLYEDECFLCHPELKSEAEAETSTESTSNPVAAAFKSLAAASAPGLFCNEHQVPEIECGICQPGLATSLKHGQGLKIRFVSKESTAKAGIETASPTVTDSAPSVRVFTEVGYNENALARITPQAPGIVRRVLVDVGSAVKAGDVLAELDSPELARAKSDYMSKLQAVELAEIDLSRSRVLHGNTQKALAISKGAISETELEALSKLDLGLNRRDLLTTHARFAVSKTELEREKLLLAQKVGSRADFQSAEAAYRMAWAEKLAVQDELAFSSNRDLESKSRTQKAATFDLESAKRQLLTLGLSETQILETPNESSAELARQYVRAAIDGVIINRTASIGEFVEPGHPLLTVADLSEMWLMLSIPADQSSLIKKGMSVEAELPDLRGAEVSGKIAWVDSLIDERSRMVKARAVISNPERLLKAGMFGKARIAIGQATQALRVPREAIQQYEKRPYVFVKIEDDLYAMRSVAIGAKTDGTADVLVGLKPNEPVVVAGAFTVLSEFLKSRLGAGCVDH